MRRLVQHMMDKSLKDFESRLEERIDERVRSLVAGIADEERSRLLEAIQKVVNAGKK